jgi:wyosine [tRNA(Phe)-imidazoG37] synthetase (radical SAM superfamily)
MMNFVSQDCPTKLSQLLDQLVVDRSNAEALRRLKDGLSQATDYEKSLIQTYKEFERCIPSTFFIESVLACNLQCPECAIGGEITSRTKKIMSFEDFQCLADKISPYCQYLLLHMWGEPTMNKDIFKMITYAAQFARVNISTNALLLDEPRTKALINSGVSDLIVSIDGVSQEVYEKYRVGGKVERAFDALRMLTSYNHQSGNNVNIMPQFIVFAHNKHEMKIFSEICQQLQLQPCFKAPYIRNENSPFKASNIPQYQRQTYDTQDSLVQAISTCSDPRNVMTIDVHGNAILCCHDYDASMNYGNLFTSSVDDIWYSPKYRLDRWNIMRGKPTEFCLTKCMTYVSSDKYPVE